MAIPYNATSPATFTRMQLRTSAVQFLTSGGNTNKLVATKNFPGKMTIVSQVKLQNGNISSYQSFHVWTFASATQVLMENPNTGALEVDIPAVIQTRGSQNILVPVLYDASLDFDTDILPHIPTTVGLLDADVTSA